MSSRSKPIHRSRRVVLVVLCALAAWPGRAGAGSEIWISAARLATLPMSGPAWEGLAAAADRPLSAPDLSNMNDAANVRVMAKALVYARTGRAAYRDEVVNACRAVMGTEGDSTLALGRELAAYVIAADLVGLPPADDAAFRTWLRAVRDEKIGSRTLVSTHEDRPNNWGTHAGASRIALAAYLGDRDELERAATVFRGWLGDRSAYARFKYGALDWQGDERAPRGINAAGATKHGHSVDGVLPDDQRRKGAFRWPPPRENYVYEGLQGALAQAVLLHRAGYDVWEWSDRALLRAFSWLHEQADYPADGDDTWQPHVINHYYGTRFPAPTPSRPGKNVGWTDWTHAGAGTGSDGGGQGGEEDGGGGGAAGEDDEMVGACPATAPHAGCRLHRVAQLLVVRRSSGALKVRWRWSEDREPTGSDWGDPATTTGYALCAYDSSSGSMPLAFGLSLPAGIDWSTRGDRRHHYRAPPQPYQGSVSLGLRAGPPGQARIRLKLRARLLDLLTPAPPARLFAQDPLVTIVALNDRGDCWSSPFTLRDTVANKPHGFRARSG